MTIKVSFYQSGNVASKANFNENNQLHSENDEPARIDYCDNGEHTLYNEYWYSEGKMTRNGAPAMRAYNSRGKLIEEVFYQNNMIHNENGPAVVDHDPHAVQYWLNDERLTKENWQNEIDPIKFAKIKEELKRLSKLIEGDYCPGTYVESMLNDIMKDIISILPELTTAKESKS